MHVQDLKQDPEQKTSLTGTLILYITLVTNGMIFPAIYIIHYYLDQ